MNDKRPIFQPIFGKSWHNLPEVFRKHYANKPYSNDCYIANGVMNIEIGLIFKILKPFLKLFKALVPLEGKNIVAKVSFESQPDSNNFVLNRQFFFTSGEHNFTSVLVPVKGNILIEYMKLGIGWKHQFLYQDNKVQLLHKGYVWKLFGINVPIPLGLLIGKGYAFEQAIDKHSFNMKMTITHWLFGKTYEYNGVFKIDD